MSRYRKPALYIGGFAIAVSLWSFQDDLFQISKNLDVFASVYKEVNINYVDDINSAKLVKTGVDAMLEGLDPYTEFVPESEIEDYKLHYVSTQYGGIGASIFLRDNKIYISDVFAGFPAQKADVRQGDQLLKINDIELAGKTNDQVSQLLKGSKGAVIKLLLKRDADAPGVKTLTRDEIKQPNVVYTGMVAHNMGYIKLNKFLENSAQEVTDALIALKKNNPNGIILDLRSNGGGILQEAVKIVNLFVQKDVQVVSQRGKVKEKNFTYNTVSTPLEPNLPLVVLVNSRSASASEIVAGALQDLDRAIIIGQRSYGKGLVQQTFNLPYNSLVKVTVAKYFVPSGRCVQELDYTHRKDDGSVIKMADSSIHEFKTRNGRSVYDGSGIYPDIFIKQDRFANITQTLVSKLFVFDYATKYRNTHPQPIDPKSFTLTDEGYADFTKYLEGKNYTYNTISEKMLSSLKTEATKEKQFTGIQAEYDALKAKMAASKKNDLQLHKEEIKQVLENEIASRYGYEKGRYEANFKYDKELAEAVKTMQDKTQLASILKGVGDYKTIGKPVFAMAGKKEDKDND
ncbi:MULTISPECIES: S41 family peptidase [unclassified Mucilaginibacter]|uniref:S41 family peptidase n=1 Tax=unclassified Mucilaginibacter TaxID=2617802 RepID=UPI002AC90831|nr:MULTISPECIES: S41 family peptidase [unclassified Mucilaginibacter]MEB0260865.1 S41 family peptidase [Mucilaginibacter sp. 10I4]MEB0278455.1 S41 family peptidase [Mucilaginibacter sp. 10B2]MEB0303122.1 S41 family peptidase [Mucilaginibacter sp. 5C4]WPX24099.1 S41 family peptidase [Mucilaginibacter sp. 5C4]